MPRRPAILTQAEVSRVIRAARAEGVGVVEIERDGTIRILIAPKLVDDDLEDRREIVL